MESAFSGSIGILACDVCKFLSLLGIYSAFIQRLAIAQPI